MIILGLGSNLEDRLQNLRTAICYIKKIPKVTFIRSSALYLSDALLLKDAPLEWQKPYLNMAVQIETSLDPFALLTTIKNIENNMGRVAKEKWAPRLIDIDILLWDKLILNHETLTIPHKELFNRPFALWPVEDLLPFYQFKSDSFQDKTIAEMVMPFGSRYNREAPFRTQKLNHQIEAPSLMGILNLTEDSFSDGKQFLATEKAYQHFITLANQGAEIIDLGGASTSPHAKLISIEEEWQHLLPVLEILSELKSKTWVTPKISIDTYHPVIAERALAFGIDFINDVSGLTHPKMQEIVKHNPIKCVMMHHLTIPADKNILFPSHLNPITTLYTWAEEQLKHLEKIGIDLTKIIFDPGIGFGKTATQSLFIIKNIASFKTLPVSILVGHSRKSFLSLFTDKIPIEREVETLVCSLYLATKKIDYLRIHDVSSCARALNMAHAL